ncbi:MAG: hypothetical protein MZV63_67385 [Marinilabiliales bacterium]|nr:hypothetical protein [Marinilabiliales bacterium]
MILMISGSQSRYADIPAQTPPNTRRSGSRYILRCDRGGLSPEELLPLMTSGDPSMAITSSTSFMVDDLLVGIEPHLEQLGYPALNISHDLGSA